MTYAGAWDRVEGGHARALLLAIAVPALLIAIGIVLELFHDDSDSFDLGAQLFIFGIAFLISLPVIAIAVFVIGLPLTWLLARWRLERMWTYPAAGFVAGAGILLLTPLFESRDGSTVIRLEDLPWLLIGALPGALSGAIWWWAHRRHVRRG